MTFISKLLMVIVLMNTFILNSQTTQSQKDTIQIANSLNLKKSKTLLHKSIVPASLIGIGLLVNNSNFEKNLQTDIQDKTRNNFQTSVDDYLLFVPVVQMYVADAFGMTSKNHWFDQTKYLFISNVVSTGISELLKATITKTRPDGDDINSFPSGHTTIAFTNAAVLQNEFQETSTVFAYSGYAFAATTGVFRMLNNKHYLSDVLVGAGVGIFVTQLVYHFEPFKNFNPFKKSKDISFFPQYKENAYGFYFKYEF